MNGIAFRSLTVCNARMSVAMKINPCFIKDSVPPVVPFAEHLGECRRPPSKDSMNSAHGQTELVKAGKEGSDKVNISSVMELVFVCDR